MYIIYKCLIKLSDRSPQCRANLPSLLLTSSLYQPANPDPICPFSLFSKATPSIHTNFHRIAWCINPCSWQYTCEIWYYDRLLHVPLPRGPRLQPSDGSDWTGFALCLPAAMWFTLGDFSDLGIRRAGLRPRFNLTDGRQRTSQSVTWRPFSNHLLGQEAKEIFSRRTRGWYHDFLGVLDAALNTATWRNFIVSWYPFIFSFPLIYSLIRLIMVFRSFENRIVWSIRVMF